MNLFKLLNKTFFLLGAFATTASLSACNPTGDTQVGFGYAASVAISYQNSYVTVSGPQIASGNSATVTLHLRDVDNISFPTDVPVINFQLIGGTSTGSLSPVVNNRDGTYTAQFSATTIGSPLQVIGYINGQVLTSTVPTLQVTSGTFSLSNSTVTLSSSVVGSGQSITSTLTVRDQNNNRVQSGGLSVSFALGNGSSTGAFGAVIDHLDGTYSSTFTGAIAGTASRVSAVIGASSVSSNLPTVTVTGGTPSTIAIVSGNSQSAISGSTLTNPLLVVVKDSNSNVLANANITWTITGGGGSLSTCAAQTNSAGQAQCSDTLGATNGTQTISAAVSGVTSPVTFTESGFSGSAATIAVSSGNNQSATAGSALSANVVAVVKDANGNSVSGTTVIWAVSAGNGSVSSCSTSSDASGLIHCAFRTGVTSGTNTITATASGITTPASFNETGSVGAAASIVVSSGSAQSGTAGSPLAGALVAIVKDPNSNLVTGATITWTVTTGAGTLSSCTTSTNSSGQAQCIYTIGASSGSNSITASVSGVATPATFTETAVAGAVSSIAFSSIISTVTANVAQTLALTEYDTHHNVVTSDSTSNITLAAYSTSDCSGTALGSGLSATTQTSSSGVATYTNFSISTSNVQSILASLGTKTVCASSLKVIPNAPTGLTITPGNASITLAWTASTSGASTYSISRGTSSGTYGSPFTSSTNSYTDSGLTNGTTYYYVVQAIGPGGSSVASAEVYKAPGLPTLSSIPNQTVPTQVATWSENINFTLGGVSTLTCASVTPTSSNTALVSNASLSVSGSYPNCVLALNAPAASLGTTTITLTATYGSASAATSFSFYLMTTAKAVYSLRKAVPSYTGPAILVRHGTNSAQANVALDSSGTLSTNSVATITSVGTSSWTLGQTVTFGTFFSGATIYVVTLYDQSGSGLNITNSTAANQAKIVNAGTLSTTNSKPSLSFTAPNFYVVTLSAAPGQISHSLNAVGQGNGVLVTLSGASAGGQNSCLGAANTVPAGSNTGPWFGGWGEDASYAVNTSANNVDNIVTKTYLYSTTVTGYMNGTSIFSNTSTNYNLSAASIVIGGQVTSGASVQLTGTWQEVFVFYSTLSTSDRQALEHVQETYYSISGL